MNQAQRQAVILALMRELRDRDSWCGETHIQKSVHFLQDALHVPLDLEFIIYKHGPFSFELREFLGELRGSQLLDVEPVPPYGPRLAPSDSGLALIDRFPRTVSRYSDQIQFVADKLGPCDVLELEGIGTALFVTQQMPSADNETRAEEMIALKPRMELSTAHHSLQEVDKLLSEAPKAVRKQRKAAR